MARVRLHNLGFGITEDEFNFLYEKQNGECAICNVKPTGYKIHVDHDHVTGQVRGLLCVKCNLALGLFMDEKKLLMKAIDYLNGESL